MNLGRGAGGGGGHFTFKPQKKTLFRKSLRASAGGEGAKLCAVSKFGETTVRDWACSAQGPLAGTCAWTQWAELFLPQA